MPTNQLSETWQQSLVALEQGHIFLRSSHGDKSSQLPHLMLLHGIGDDGESLAQWCQPLCQHFRCLVPDLRGHGWSSRGKSYRLQDYCQDMAVILDSLDQPIHLLGHSLGGLIAIQLAQQQPDAVRSLILEDPPLFHLQASIDEKPAVAAAFGHFYQQRCAVSDHAQLLQHMLAEEPQRPLDKVLGRCRKRMACDPQVWKAALDDHLQPDAPLTSITCPTTLLAGNPAQGGVIAPSEEAILGAICPQLQSYRYENSGHTPRFAAMTAISKHLGIAQPPKD